MKVRILLLLPLVFVLSVGQELLTNGDFEQELSVGWTVDTTGYGYATFNRATGYDGDPDYEVMDSLYSGAASAKLLQVVDVPGPNLRLTFSAAFALGPTSSTCWPVAAVTVGYLDSAGNRLGETRFYYHDINCTWSPASTLSLIEVTDPGWNDYELDIAGELSDHLPGIDPGDISQVEVALLDTTAGG
jgi:hypothetical protein